MPKLDESWDSNKNKPPAGRSGLLDLLRSNRINLIVMGGLFVLWAFYVTCTTYVGPGEFGVKQVLYSPGVDEKFYIDGVLVASGAVGNGGLAVGLTALWHDISRGGDSYHVDYLAFRKDIAR